MSRSKSFQEIYADYIAAVKKIPLLEIGQDLELARRWRHANDIKARNRLVESHLGLVPRAVKKAARKYGHEWDFEKRLSLIGAGNAALFHAAFLFDPELGRRFATQAWPWISKGVWRQARFDRSNGTRPDNIKCTRDVQLDHVRKDDDRESEIALGRTPQRRTLCVTPSDDGDLLQGSNFAGMLSDGYATLIHPGEATIEASHAANEENETLSGRLDSLHAMLEAKSDQILNDREREIYRVRYLFPARKTKLKELTDRYGLSEARNSQIATEANKKVLAAINPLSGRYQGDVRFPTWLTIDDWCDHPKAARAKSIMEWCEVQTATSAERVLRSMQALAPTTSVQS